MRTSGLIGIALLAASSLLAVLAAAAAAAPHDVGRLHELTLAGTNEYEIRVVGVPKTREEPARVYLRARKGASSATYETEGLVNDRRIVAEFGDLGRVEVEFRPDGRERRVRPSCGGPPVQFDGGVFVGTVQFEGEGGYTAVAATEAPPVPDLEELCWSVEEAHGAGRGVVLEVRGEGYGVTVIENRPGARAWLGVGVYEERGAVGIDRELWGSLPSSSFDWSPDLRRATLAPSAATVSGLAWYRARGRRATSWEGNLAVDFPGRPDALVAGGPVLTRIDHGYLKYYRIHR